jgi:hypothetical protein
LELCGRISASSFPDAAGKIDYGPFAVAVTLFLRFNVLAQCAQLLIRDTMYFYLQVELGDRQQRRGFMKIVAAKQCDMCIECRHDCG